MTETQAYLYLVERGEPYDLSIDELKSLAPDCVSDDLTELAELYQHRDISHILAQNTHPELANNLDNMFLEHESPNSSRRADPTTETEIDHAEADTEVLAEHIDNGTIDDYFYEPYVSTDMPELVYF